MAKFRKIDPRIHNDRKYKALSDSAKLLFLTILTHPHMTSLGAMRMSRGGLADEMGWDARKTSESLSEALSEGMIEADFEVSFLAAPNFLKYNRPESPNVIKSWGDSLDYIPECKLKLVLLQRVKGFAKGLTKGFRKAYLSLPEDFPKDFPKAMPIHEHEHEHEFKEKKKKKKKKDFDKSPVPDWAVKKMLRAVKMAGERLVGGRPTEEDFKRQVIVCCTEINFEFTEAAFEAAMAKE